MEQGLPLASPAGQVAALAVPLDLPDVPAHRLPCDIAAVIPVPKRDQITTPSPIRTAAATKVPIAPALLIHLPTPRPTMLSRVSRESRASEVTSANILLSARPAWVGPRAKTETPTK